MGNFHRQRQSKKKLNGSFEGTVKENIRDLSDLYQRQPFYLKFSDKDKNSLDLDMNEFLLLI